jgi:hypothetical protein
VRTARRSAFALAGLLALVAPATGVAATTPPGGTEDPTLAPLLLTVADLPAGFAPFAMPPLTSDPLAPDVPADDPCYGLWHGFETAYAAPHAAAAFLRGTHAVVVHLVFRLESPRAASGLVQSFSDDMTACPVVTGADGNTTTFTPHPLPLVARGDAWAAYSGVWEFAGFVLLIAMVAVDDIVVVVDISGPGAPSDMLLELTALAVQRVEGAADDDGGATPPGGAPPVTKPELTLPSG